MNLAKITTAAALMGLLASPVLAQGDGVLNVLGADCRYSVPFHLDKSSLSARIRGELAAIAKKHAGDWLVVKANTEVIEAIVIDQSGSYYLVEDITALPDNNALTISANDVTLDLNGFTIRGNNEVNDGHGIQIEGENVTILNGTVRNADLDGIRCTEIMLMVKLVNVSSIHNTLAGVSCRYIQISNGDFSSNGTTGIAAYNMLIENVRASDNGGTGISVGGRTLVTDSLINGNGGYGVSCPQGGAMVIQSVVLGNTDGALLGCNPVNVYAP